MRHVVGVEVESDKELSEEERRTLLKSFEYFMRSTYGLGTTIVLYSRLNQPDSKEPVT